MGDQKASLHLHRFRDCAGIAVLGSFGTVYLDAKGARELARAAARLARSLERETFQQHTFNTMQIPAFPNSGAIGE